MGAMSPWEHQRQARMAMQEDAWQHMRSRMSDLHNMIDRNPALLGGDMNRVERRAVYLDRMNAIREHLRQRFGMADDEISRMFADMSAAGSHNAHSPGWLPGTAAPPTTVPWSAPTLSGRALNDMLSGVPSPGDLVRSSVPSQSLPNSAASAAHALGVLRRYAGDVMSQAPMAVPEGDGPEIGISDWLGRHPLVEISPEQAHSVVDAAGNVWENLKRATGFGPGSAYVDRPSPAPSPGPYPRL